MAKKKQRFSVTIDLENGGVRYTDKVLKTTMFFAVGPLPASIKELLLPRGLDWKLSTATASITDGDLKLAARKSFYEDYLMKGEWEREADRSGPTVSVEVQALAEYKGMLVSETQKQLRTYTDEQREAILSNPAVLEIAERMRESAGASDEGAFDDLL